MTYMRTLTLTVILLLLAAGAWAQTTSVTGTITDKNGNPYAFGTASAYKAVPLGLPAGTPTTVPTSSTGLFIMPALSSPASYTFTICSPPLNIGPTSNPTPSQVCFSSQAIAISGASQDLSVQLNAIALQLGPVGSSGSIPGNAATATALQNAPAQCGANALATGINATGVAQCTSTPTVTSLTATSGITTVTTTSTGAGTHSGAETFTGTINCTIVNVIRCISPSNPQLWAGSDAGAWINSAVACSGGCKVQIASGNYQVSTSITLPHNTWLEGAGNGNVVADTPPTLLQEANGANLAALITVSGTGVQIANIMIDGNLANNPTALDGVVVTQVKFLMPNISISNSKRHNLVLGGSTQDTRIINAKIFNAGQNGIEIQGGAGDLFLTASESINNGNYQVHSTGTVGGIHIIGGDYSGTTGGNDCIFLDGTAANVNLAQIVGVDINPCPKNGIRIINGNASVISGNIIDNIGTTGPVNTYDAVQVTNFGGYNISGNVIADGGTLCGGGPCMRYGVNVTAQTQKNEIGLNMILGAQTAAYSNPNNFDDILGGPAGTLNVINNSLRVGHAGGANTAALDLTGKAAAGTSVWFASVNGDPAQRVIATADGHFYWSSGAGAADVNLSRSGAGVLSLAGALGATGSVQGAGFLPNVAGGSDVGSAALPHGNFWLGTAATNNFKFQPAATSGARIITVADPLSPTTVGLPLTIASGTSAMTTALIATVACGTTVTTVATGVLTTDVIDWSVNAAVTAANNGLLIMKAWPTAGNVNFNYCNPTAASQTPTATTVNWSVRRP